MKKSATRAAEKIREDNLVTNVMSVFLLTNHFNKRELQYSNSTKIQFDYPTNDTILIVKKALQGLERMVLAHPLRLFVLPVPPSGRMLLQQ